ncbi:hypothetical protein ScPMuIL_000910 [Solemya velum]
MCTQTSLTYTIQSNVYSYKSNIHTYKSNVYPSNDSNQLQYSVSRRPYDTENPQNWTIPQLKTALTRVSVPIPTNARHSVLVKLYEGSLASVIRDVEDPQFQHLVDQHRRSALTRPAAASNRASHRHGLLSAIESLQTTLRTEMPTLPHVRNSRSSSATVNVPLFHGPVLAQPPTTASYSISDVSDSENGLTIASAIQALRSGTDHGLQPDISHTDSRPMVFPCDVYSTEPSVLETRGAEPMRTTYGYSAESLPFVETISP